MNRRVVAPKDTGPRIAFVSTVYDHTDVGGGTFVQYLRQAVERGELDLTFFSDDIRSPLGPYEQRVALPPAVKRIPGGFLTRAWYYHRAVQAEHRKRPFDVVWHNNAITGILHDRTSRVPNVGMINDYNNAESATPFATKDKFGAHRAFMRFGWHQIERRAAARADFLVVNSEFMAERIRDAYDLDSRRMKLLYKGVDLRQFVFRPSWKINNPVRILFIKRDFIRGGLFDLMEALRSFPIAVELTVIGPPETEHERIERMRTRVGLASMRLIASQPREAMPGCYALHDILCVPSRSEALGVTFIEALASGIPAVGTTVGGIPEVLDDGRAGWLATPQDPLNIRQTLLSVIENDIERKRKIRHGIEHVKVFSHDNMIQRVLEIACCARERNIVLR